VAAFFFERFRNEIARYAEGVHRLGEPALAPAVKGLPDELAAFLGSWNGAALFIDALEIFDAAHLERADDLLVFGATAAGDRLGLDAGGAVVRVEEDTGEILVEGTSFARWIEGFIVAEGVLYDREGDFREELFDDSGEELLPEVIERRERKALKVDPGAPAPTWRLARALARAGHERKATALLLELTARAPRFGWAWFDLGKLERMAGNAAEAEAAFAAAAETDPRYEHAGYFAAHAARSAAERGDDAARARHAARALELDPELARAQRSAAESLLGEGAIADALEAAEIAAALVPRDLAVKDLCARCRAALV
jgi:tetratricopeptide (TPR) repeat protein